MYNSAYSIHLFNDVRKITSVCICLYALSSDDRLLGMHFRTGSVYKIHNEKLVEMLLNQ